MLFGNSTEGTQRKTIKLKIVVIGHHLRTKKI